MPGRLAWNILRAFNEALNKNTLSCMYIAQYQNVIRIKIGAACLAQKGEPRSTVCTYSRNIINDDDHDISRVHYFSTVCVYNESYSYASSLFTVALPLRWNPLTCQTCGVNWNEQQTETGQIKWPKSNGDLDCMIAQHEPGFAIVFIYAHITSLTRE